MYVEMEITLQNIVGKIQRLSTLLVMQTEVVTKTLRAPITETRETIQTSLGVEISKVKGLLNIDHKVGIHSTINRYSNRLSKLTQAI